MSIRARAAKYVLLLAASCLAIFALPLMTGCSKSPSITFLEVPPASSGGSESTGIIRGQVAGRHHGRHIFLYAYASGSWWVQPFASSPSTVIEEDGSWKANIHLGTEYAALLVKNDTLPPHLLDALPTVGKTVEAVARVKANGGEPLRSESSSMGPTLRFSGLDWKVRTIPGDYGAKTNEYSSDNVSVDSHGALHLRLNRNAHGWVCSEIHSARSLGYGNYSLDVMDISQLEPAVMFSIFTYFQDPKGSGHSEMDIHLTRRGVASNKNAEFVIQPSFVPTNFYHFDLPPGRVRLGLNWQSDEAGFSSSVDGSHGRQGNTSWVFKTGVPSPDDTHLYINLCNYGYAPAPPTHDAEVVVKAFEFYP